MAKLARALRTDSLADVDLRQLAQMLRKKGRGRDTVLAHITPQEAKLLKRRGTLVVISNFFDEPAAIFQALSPYLHRGFRVYWVGQWVSVNGTWMQTTAQAWLVYRLTNSPLALGLLLLWRALRRPA